MDVSITGTVLNPQTFNPSPFSMQFDISGGMLQSAGCDSALMGASVTDFSAEIGNNPFQAAPAFAANITSSGFPCGSGDVFGELVSGPMTLESQGNLLVDHSRIFDGNIGTWHIETAQLTITPAPEITSVPEPGCLALLALGIAAILGRRSMRSRTAA